MSRSPGWLFHRTILWGPMARVFAYEAVPPRIIVVPPMARMAYSNRTRTENLTETMAQADFL